MQEPHTQKPWQDHMNMKHSRRARIQPSVDFMHSFLKKRRKKKKRMGKNATRQQSETSKKKAAPEEDNIYRIFFSLLKWNAR